MAWSGIAVETPANSRAATQNLLDPPTLAVENPVIWPKVDQQRKIAGGIGVNFNEIDHGEHAHADANANLLGLQGSGHGGGNADEKVNQRIQ
ncbi:hypothetical protein [Paenibacillus silvestris]|uniref:hypothetical protein n=1 Tax=Paenibacillus silvestris TaxID=2606219 RepID=UPI0013730138|nr:hypothetical protein [Paenibacillus silvestris]